MSLERNPDRPGAGLDPSAGASDIQLQKDLISYQMMTQRELDKDSKIWQAPILGMTAQAFLLTIALNGQATRTAAIIASALALVLSAVTLHLMLKHRWWQWLHRSVLSRMESDLGLEKITNLEDFYPRTDQDGTPREKTGKLHPKSYYLDPGWSVHHEPPGREPWIYRLRTFRIWIVGMTLVFIADLAILLMRISDSSLLTASTTTTNMP